MKTIPAVVSLILILSAIAFSQEPEPGKFEYGKPEDMRGLKTVYVDTGSDLDERNRIIRLLEKFGSGLKQVDRPSDADILIVYNTTSTRQSYTRTVAGAPGTAPLSLPGAYTLDSGKGVVTVNGKEPSIRRVVYNFESGRRDPLAGFVRKFVKLYKEVNQ
jgi:hypothetical protein